MHHTLKFYSCQRENILRFYMFGARCTKIPLIGRLVRRVANTYGRNMEGAYLLTPAEAEKIVESAEGLAVGPCTCRTVFKNCDNSINTELLIGPERQTFKASRPADHREITKEEARAILKQCHEKGLIHTIIKCREDFYAICNCCACCCVPLRMSKKYGIGGALTRHPDIVGEFKTHQVLHET